MKYQFFAGLYFDGDKSDDINYLYNVWIQIQMYVKRIAFLVISFGVTC